MLFLMGSFEDVNNILTQYVNDFLIIIGKISFLPGDLKSLNSLNAALTFLKVKKLITFSISCPLPAGVLGRESLGLIHLNSWENVFLVTVVGFLPRFW